MMSNKTNDPSHVPWTWILADPLPGDSLYLGVYRLQLGLSSTATVIDFLMMLVAFSSESHFSPYQPIVRALFIMSMVVDGTYVVDAFKALVQLWDVPIDGLITTSDCSENKPYQYIVIVCRQWGALAVMVMGLERFLVMRYPLWFKSMRVGKCLLIVSTLIFSAISAFVAYINAQVASPFALEYYTCEATFAFGDYGYINCFFVMGPLLLGSVLNISAGRYINSERILVLFGNNRAKLASEKRKIKKLKPILAAEMTFIFLPQAALLALRILSNHHLQLLKLLASQLFLGKWIANMAMYRVMTRRKKGVLEDIKQWWEQRCKAKVCPNDSSITSVSLQIERFRQLRQLQQRPQLPAQQQTPLQPILPSSIPA